MANAGKTSSSATILLDEIKSRLSGILDYTPADSTEKWIYKQHSVPASPEVIFSTNDEYTGNLAASDSVANGDKILWIAVKHTGKINTTNAKTSEGIMLNFTGTSPLFGGTNDAGTNNIVIGPGELFVCKLNGVLAEDLKVGTCVLSSNKPSAIGASTVLAHVAAIIDDIA